jgi:SAM-dependent methyltransferase
MAHVGQMLFFQNIKQFLPDFFSNSKVLEIGSLDINGSVRRFFDSCEYIGIDIGPGPKVDMVCRGEDFTDKAGQYDVVISTEVFEHTENWDLIFLNMLRLMKRTGMIIFSCAGWGREQHGTSLFHPDMAPFVASNNDYYKNLASTDFLDAFRMEYWFSCHTFITDGDCLYFAGIGRNANKYIENMIQFKAVYQEYIYKKNVLGLPDTFLLRLPNNRIEVP